MKSTGRAVLRALFACGFLSLANSAHAQAIRFISTTGADTNNCSLTAPCRNLQRGINATPAGGELRVLDSGGYGFQGVIAKSMTISGQGNTLLMGGSPAISVNNASAVVVLRGLHLNGRNLLDDGIFVQASAAVHILGCRLERYTNAGINLGGTNTEYFVADTTSSDNGVDGLSVNSNGGTATITIDRSIFENNVRFGINLVDVESSVSDTVASGNTEAGIVQTNGRSNMTRVTASGNDDYGFNTDGEMTLEFSTGRGNRLAGLRVVGSGSARVSNSTFTDNEIGIENFGPVETRENNTVAGNVQDVLDPNPPNFVTLPPT